MRFIKKRPVFTGLLLSFKKICIFDWVRLVVITQLIVQKVYMCLYGISDALGQLIIAVRV